VKRRWETRCGGLALTTEKIRMGSKMSPETTVGEVVEVSTLLVGVESLASIGLDRDWVAIKGDLEGESVEGRKNPAAAAREES
jgi:hypothetical protein